MPTTFVPEPIPLLRYHYERAASEYCQSLPLEHFMESTAQSTQRKITDASLDLVKAQRPDVHPFGELLIQYPKGSDLKKIARVCPDNMVVLFDGPIKASGSFDTPMQPVGPFWVLEYVSKGNARKDYDDNMEKYEKALKVPYYTLFYPETLDLTTYKMMRSRKYSTLRPEASFRCRIAELDIEIGLVDGWLRYWFREKLLPLPVEMAEQLEEAHTELERKDREIERLKAELDRVRKNGKH
jgi:Uma2 family endonuclease